MSEPTRKGATYEDVVAAPDDKIAELLEGDLYLSPRPSPRHANAASALASDLHDAFQRGRSGPGGWWILFEPEIHLRDDVLVPDIGGWRRERLPDLPELPWFEMAPDWLCEVISPSTARIDREKKLPIYARAGVEYVWIVDPPLRTLEVLRRRGDRFILAGAHFGETSVSAPPFEESAIELGPLWT
ncbi:MAG TPA: Uma2 family endonuclease [Thermoanaerobaculia bacterium]|nr:Uma2 family endonuclease [Thermoanaerobaculia bacterium]